MDSSQKRDRDRKQRQRRQDKEERRKERAREKVLRLTGGSIPSATASEGVPEAQPKDDLAPEVPLSP